MSAIFNQVRHFCFRIYNIELDPIKIRFFETVTIIINN